MDEQTPSPSSGKKPGRKGFVGRWLRRVVLLLVVVLAGGAYGLPWLAGTAPGRAFLIGTVNRAIAPSTVRAGGVSLSWSGPIRLSGVSLTNGQGKRLIDAESVSINQGLLALWRDPSSLGTITVENAKVDIERAEDGSIDLVEAVRVPHGDAPTTPEPDPKKASKPLDLTLRVNSGTLRFATPELAEPIQAGAMELDVRYPAAQGEKLTFRLALADPREGDGTEPVAPSGTLVIDGRYDHQAMESPGLGVTVTGGRWALAYRSGGATASGILVGVVEVAREAGLWSAKGDARLHIFQASGPSLAGDRLVLESLGGVWDLAETDAADWSVRRLDLTSPVGSLVASGSVAADAPGDASDVQIEGKIDLAALSEQIPHAMRLRPGLVLDRGEAHVRIVTTGGEPTAAGQTAAPTRQGTIEASISDFAAHDANRQYTLNNPASLRVVGMLSGPGSRVDDLEFKSAFLNLKGKGGLADGVKFEGRVDLGAIEDQFRDLIDFQGVSMAGKGRVVGDYHREPDGKGYTAQLLTEMLNLKLAGLTAEPIVRDAIRVETTVKGASNPKGLPLTWSQVDGQLASSRDSIAFRVIDRKDAYDVAATVLLPLKVAARDGLADVRMQGRWTPGKEGAQGVVDLDRFRLVLQPADERLRPGAVLTVDAKGRIDLDQDVIELLPVDGGAGASQTGLAMGAEGVKVKGLRRSILDGGLVTADLAGELGLLDRALVVWLDQSPLGLHGPYTLKGSLLPADGKPRISLTAVMPNLVREGEGLGGMVAEGPVNLAFNGVYDGAADHLTVEGLTTTSRYVQVAMTGSVDECSSRRIASATGILTPNWRTLTMMLAQATESQARLEGEPHPFQIKGPLTAGSLAAFVREAEGVVVLSVTSAGAFGLETGRMPLILRASGGSLTIDPIATTLNGGQMLLKPGLVIDDVQGIALQFYEGSAINGASINDEVSQRVLSYVAPVLGKATQVRGTIAGNVRTADIPITGPPERTMTLNGHLAFQDVVFSPGPGALEILSLLGKADLATLKMEQPVELSVANRRVYQKGLAMTIRNDAKLSLEGSVGFDKTLDLRAGVPITQAMLGGGQTVANDLLADKTVTVPIGGTVARPIVNKQALRVALGELSRGVLKKELSREAAKLLKLPQTQPGANPNAAANGNDSDAVITPDQVEALGNELIRRITPRRRK